MWWLIIHCFWNWKQGWGSLPKSQSLTRVEFQLADFGHGLASMGFTPSLRCAVLRCVQVSDGVVVLCPSFLHRISGSYFPAWVAWVLWPPAPWLILALRASSNHPRASLSFMPQWHEQLINSPGLRLGITSVLHPTVNGLNARVTMFAGLHSC